MEESLPEEALRDAQAHSELARLQTRILELEARDRARARELAYFKAALRDCREEVASLRAQLQAQPPAPSPLEEQVKWNRLWSTLTSMRQVMKEESVAAKAQLHLLESQQRLLDERILFDGVAIRGEQREIRRLVPEQRAAAMRAEIRESTEDVVASLSYVYHQLLARFGEAMG